MNAALNNVQYRTQQCILMLHLRDVQVILVSCLKVLNALFIINHVAALHLPHAVYAGCLSETFVVVYPNTEYDK
jgi:hypothetical protein